jgi:hypothetical protein
VPELEITQVWNAEVRPLAEEAWRSYRPELRRQHFHSHLSRALPHTTTPQSIQRFSGA